MRIAHVITRLIIGGAQENTILSCEGLMARGHEVVLIAGPETGPEGSLWPRAERTCGDVVRVDSLLRNIHPLSEVRCVRELTSIFKRGGFDIVHTHSSKAGIIGRYAAYRAGVPAVVHTIHGMSFNRTQGRMSRWLYRELERRAAHWTDAFVSVADAMTGQAVEAGIANASKFCTIRSGMETDLFRPCEEERIRVRRSWGIDEEAVVIGTVARLFHNKGYKEIISAMPGVAAACPDARFVWVGDGPQRDEYIRELERMGLRDRVHLTGLVHPTEIPAILCGFDVLVHASLWEGLARAIVQAALSEVPAVSFDNDGAPEVVLDGETGKLAPVGDFMALSAHISLLANNKELRIKLGKRARTKCLGEFSHERMVVQLEQLYERLAGAGRVRRS